VVREDGSGTRSILHQTLIKLGVPFSDQRIAIALPSNEAVMTAVIAGVGPTLLSGSVCADSIAANRLKRLPIVLESRPFYAVQRADHYRSRALSTLLGMLKEPGGGPCRRQAARITASVTMRRR
jgi:DNA-binding transcriptional LysR family regulator